MKMYTDLSEPSRDLNTYLRENWSKLPAPVQEEVAKFDGPGNTQDRNAYIVECMYAAYLRGEKSLKNDTVRGIIGAIALYYGTVLGILYFKDGRGEKIANAMRRDMGEAGFDQAPADDPEPLAQYVVTDEAPDAAPAPPAA